MLNKRLYGYYRQEKYKKADKLEIEDYTNIQASMKRRDRYIVDVSKFKIAV